VVWVLGAFAAEFLAELKKKGAVVSRGKGKPAWILLAADALDDLARVKGAAGALKDAAGLWIVYPKGRKEIREHDVRGTGLRAGLTDVKVASFSETHTALKFVIPVAKRQGN
jgi:hypothetical protein